MNAKNSEYSKVETPWVRIKSYFVTGSFCVVLHFWVLFDRQLDLIWILLLIGFDKGTKLLWNLNIEKLPELEQREFRCHSTDRRLPPMLLRRFRRRRCCCRRRTTLRWLQISRRWHRDLSTFLPETKKI